SLRLPWDDAVVYDKLQAERREVDVPGFNQRIQERDAVLSAHVEDVRIEELEHDDPHLLVAAATEPSHHPEPVVILELVFRHALDHIQQRLGDEAFELAERLLYVVDRKSTRLNSSHGSISYAVFCLKKKK